MQINIYKTYEYIPSLNSIINITKLKNNIHYYHTNYINLFINKNNELSIYDYNKFNYFLLNLFNTNKDIDILFTEDKSLANTIKLFLQYLYNTEDKYEYKDIKIELNINIKLLKQLTKERVMENELLENLIKWNNIRSKAVTIYDIDKYAE